MFSYVFMKLLEGRPESYDRRVERVSGGHIRAIKEQIVDAIDPGTHVLEVGCGTGELATMIAARGATVLAFDASEKMVAEARDRMAREGLEEKVTVQSMAVTAMDRLDAASFDAVVATLVLSELTRDEERYALRHAVRVLRPGGRLLLADEVVPRTTGRRLAYQAVRLPVLAVTYLVSTSSTRPLENLPETLRHLGLEVLQEERSLGDAFALVVARKPQQDKEVEA